MRHAQVFTFPVRFSIRHLHISHNAPYLRPKSLHNLFFNFSWVLQPSQVKNKRMLMQNFGGKQGAVQVAYPRR